MLTGSGSEPIAGSFRRCSVAAFAVVADIFAAAVDTVVAGIVVGHCL